MDQFVEQLRQVSPLSDEIVGQLLEEMKEVSFAKGELSIREGERDPFCLVRENRIWSGLCGA